MHCEFVTKKAQTLYGRIGDLLGLFCKNFTKLYCGRETAGHFTEYIVINRHALKLFFFQKCTTRNLFIHVVMKCTNHVRYTYLYIGLNLTTTLFKCSNSMAVLTLYIHYHLSGIGPARMVYVFPLLSLWREYYFYITFSISSRLSKTFKTFPRSCMFVSATCESPAANHGFFPA